MVECFDVYGNYYLYKKSLSDGKIVGIQENRKEYILFISDRHDNVEQVLLVANKNDLDVITEMLNVFKDLL